MRGENNNSNEQSWKLFVLLLRKIAESKGISQGQLADLTGLKQSNISRMFNLQYCPNMRTFTNVSKAIGVNLFIEDKTGDTDITATFNQAMGELGRRTESSSNN
ncbi:MAG: helix-turn-helix transcriptional regulator [Cyclobacteriaceae bacterium]|nr:helix-turn-helix transcriptional regulator [Cyclobacteriaceae bacterium]